MPYKPKQVLSILKQLGFIEKRQAGSHLLLMHPDGRRIVLPMHNTDLKKGLFLALLKDARLTLTEFRERL